MENNILSIVAIVTSFFGTICAIINHKKIRSKCLSEKEMVISLDIDNTTPQKKENDLKIKIPKIKDDEKLEENSNKD